MMHVIMSLLEIIVILIIAGVFWWAINALLPMIPLPDQIRRVINVLLTVIIVLIVLWVIIGLLGLFGQSLHVGVLLVPVYA